MAIFIKSPNGADVNTLSDLATVAASPQAAGRIITITSPITIDTVTVAVGITIRAESEGSISVNTGHTFTNNGITDNVPFIGAGNITLNGPANYSDALIGNSGTITINGPFRGGSSLYFTGSGTVVLSNIDAALPEWFGNNATPGTTDMTTAIQAAINSFPVVQFGSSTYLSGALSVKSNTVLKGAGANNSTIKLKASANTPLITRSDAYLGDNYPTVNALTEITNVKILDLTLDGNCSNQSAPTSSSWDWLVFLQRVSNASVKNCIIQNCKVGGVILHQCKNSVIEGNTVSNAVQSGSIYNYITSFRTFTAGINPHLVSAESGNRIVNNTVYVPLALRDTTGYGISSEYSRGDTISGNTVYNGAVGGESALSLAIAHNVTDGSRGFSCSDTASLNATYGLTGLVVKNNHAMNAYFSKSSGVSASGIIVTGYKAPIVSGNVVSKADTSGAASWGQISVSSCTDAQVIDNVCKVPVSTSLYGLIIYQSTGTNVSGGLYESISHDGVLINNSPNTTIKRSKLTNIGATASNSAITYSNAPKNCNISDNTISGYVSGFVSGSGNTTLQGLKNVVANNTYLTNVNPVPGETVQGDVLASITTYGNAVYYGTVPTVGTWVIGDRTLRKTPTVGQPKSWACTTSGTFGTLNSGTTRANTTAGSADIVVSSATGIEVGVFITVAGIGGTTSKRVVAINGTTVTVDTTATNTVTAGACSYVTPVFTSEGVL